MKRTNINWNKVRDRLRESERALEEAGTESPDRIAAAYRLRAERLALEDAAPKPISSSMPALAFWLAEELYAVALEELGEVLPFEHCVPVPGAPSPFRGVINLRGEIRTVVDLRCLLLNSESEDGDASFVLMLRRPGREIGLRVDRIEGLRQIRLEEFTLPVEGNYVKGVGAGPLMLLNVEAVLAHVFSKEGVYSA
jgi:purine-binding chemotaxis protein CheW